MKAMSMAKKWRLGALAVAPIRGLALHGAGLARSLTSGTNKAGVLDH